MSSLYKNIFVTLSLMGCLVSMSSESWFTLWVGMEISIFFFVAILASWHSSGYTQLVATWKFFIYQSVSSLLILYSIILFSMEKSEMAFIWMVLGLLVKMGLFPFQGWVFSVLENSSLVCIFFFSSIQKIPPLIICFWWGGEKLVGEFLEWSVLFSVVWVIVACLSKNISVKMILILSSILSSSWMVGSSVSSWVDLCIFFLFYSIHLSFFLASLASSPFSSEISSLHGGKEVNLLGVFLLGMFVGVPPFGMFYSKLSVVTSLMASNAILGMALLMGSMFMLFCYLNFVFSMFLSGGEFSLRKGTLLLFFSLSAVVAAVVVISFF